ncbi:protein NEDD1-like isoform X2 [Mizuhopecten yessoensis]|uniref:Protein NEDD1 n=1 Tax=Mizuhopecten yessoensis TaxID=6573 RepID=A0A210QZR4_MIZYE|nr:protein NEDD1-like isoform X2 [Mizuhopecten yessoensis]OWF54240.1 Protein NEDD1 [Mizuhopecten yessoensis]
MSGMKLASAGDDIKLWDVDSSFSMVRQFNPHDHNVSNVCWSHDNSYLSSVSNSSDKLSLTAVKNSSVSILDLKFVTGKGFLDFNSTSRYIVSGVDQAINVWDLKVRSLRKTYKGHTGKVTCAKFNWNDTYIASGSDTGEIIVYNAVSGQGCSPMVAPKAQAVKEIQYSHFKKSLLGSASDDGAVNLWDTNTRRLIHSFSDAHRAPATGINFSPINAIFLMSVGLDKRIICYDLEGKKYPKVIVAESPLTSIDVMPDGATVAVGSTRGKIYIYDLRQGDTPVKVLNAHKSSVQCLRFTNSLQTEALSKSAAKIASSKDVSPPNRRQLPQAPAESSNITVEATDYGPRRADSGVPDNDTFSPVKDTHGYSDRETEQMSNSGSNLGSFLQQENQSSSGVFSPLADAGTFSNRENIGMSPLFTNHSNSNTPSWNTPASNFNTYGLTVNGSRTQQDGYYSNSKFSSPPGMGTSSSANHVDPHNIQDSAMLSNGGSPYLQNGISRSDIQGQGPVYQGQTGVYRSSTSPSHPTPSHVGAEVPPRVSPSRPTGISASPSIPVLNLDDSPGSCAGADNSGAKQFPSPEGVNAVTSVYTSSIDTTSQNLSNRGKSSYNLAHRSQSSHDQAHRDQSSKDILRGSYSSQDQVYGGQSSQEGQKLEMAPQAIPSGNFQTQVLRNLIREELEDFYDQMHREMQNLQVEMIRQFQIQQNEVNSLLQHYSVNQDLVAEVEKLREENKRLKKHF